jgi:hypothetical protein
MGKPIEIKTKEELLKIFGQPQELTEDQKKLINENINKDYNPWFIRIDENEIDPRIF